MRLTSTRSLTLRLTLYFAIASSAALLIVGLAVGLLVERHFEEQDLEELAGKMHMIRANVAALDREQALGEFAEFVTHSLAGHAGVFVILRDHQGKTIYDSLNQTIPVDWISLAEKNPTHHQFTPYEWVVNNLPLRAIVTELNTSIPGQSGVYALVAMDISLHHRFMQSFSRTLWLFVLAAAVCTGLLGWVVARQGLSPLRTMREKAEAVTAAKLDHRLPVDSVPKELAELAQTLNEMLGRLEEAFRRISDFSSDIAHELRTPISALITQTQVTLSRTRTAEEYRSVLEASAEEYERLAKMIADMLFLAKSENGLAVPGLAKVDIRHEVSDLFEFYEVLASDRGIRLGCEGEGHVRGDRLMLRRALGNLLSNAIYHTPDEAAVQVAIESTGGSVTITVTNQGDTIPAEHLDRLFDRFYRADPSRQRHGEGSGLGLAITKSIVIAHGGEIGVRSKDGNTAFWMSLPASPA